MAKFYSNAFQNRLPQPANLQRCLLRMEIPVCFVRLFQQKQLLVVLRPWDERRYTRRHDKILIVIQEFVSLVTARVKRQKNECWTITSVKVSTPLLSKILPMPATSINGNSDDWEIEKMLEINTMSFLLKQQ